MFGCVLLAGFVIGLTGCISDSPESVTPADDLPLSGVTLKIAVVDDSELTAAIAQERGEWAGQTGADLTVIGVTWPELESKKRLDYDAIIGPSWLLGELAEKELIATMPKKMLRSDSIGLNDIFQLPRLRVSTWGSNFYAIPFGSPVFVCYYRKDLLEELDMKPPETWEEYEHLSKRLANRTALGRLAPTKDVPWYGSIEPLGPNWAGLVLLARAAPYAKHSDNYSTLFDIETMEPLIDSHPIVRALNELVTLAKAGPADQLRFDPADVRSEFWSGHCGLALTCPTATDRQSAPGPKIKASIAELPGADTVYNRDEGSWVKRKNDDEMRIPLLSIDGRLGVVSINSPNQAAAFQSLLWLSGSQGDRRPSMASRGSTMFRKWHTRRPIGWVESSMPAVTAGRYAATLSRTLNRKQWLFALRIPGRSEYLKALDEAVHKAIEGRLHPVDALSQAADQWRNITQKLGRKRQLKAYLHSLGLEPYHSQ